MAVPSWRVIGIDTLEIEGRREDILNALELWEVEYSDLKASQEGISIKLPRYQSRKVEDFLRAKSFSCRITKRRGLPVFLLKLMKRPGLIVGMAFFLISMYFYGSFVFDIWLVMAAAMTVGENLFPTSFCTIRTGRSPPCSDPTTGERSA